MKDYCPDKWLKVLRHNGLDSFERLWSLQAEWFEEPNQRRGGWSGVCRIELALPEGGKVNLFRKTQENHNSHTLRHPLGIPTFIREMNNILMFKQAAVPALEPVYFAMRNVGGDKRAILCTEALEGYTTLECMVQNWEQDGWPQRKIRLNIMHSVAAVMNRMHDHKIQHNCFYPKHIFLRFDQDGGVSVRLIDLEKAKLRPLRGTAAFRDLYTLNRHSPGWSRTDRLRFFLTYLGQKSLDAKAKALWRRIGRKLASKAHS